MKNNNKGFTLIELVLGIGLIVLIILPVFGTVVSYKNKEITESNKSELINFKNIVTTTIQDDIVKYGLKYMCNKIIKADGQIDSFKHRLMFRNNDDNIKYADIEIDDLKKIITYTKYDNDNNQVNVEKFVVPVGDAVIENSAYLYEKSGVLGYKYFYQFSYNLLKVIHNSDSSKAYGTIAKIMIPITFEGKDFGIDVTTTYVLDIKNDEIDISRDSYRPDQFCGVDVDHGDDATKMTYTHCIEGTNYDTDTQTCSKLSFSQNQPELDENGALSSD